MWAVELLSLILCKCVPILLAHACPCAHNISWLAGIVAARGGFAMARKSVSAAARQLSLLGASKGGIARREKLTSEQRTESARIAAAARWSIPRATFEGDLHIGEIEIPCYVLDNGTRLISHRGLQRSLGLAISGGAQNTARFVASIEAKVQSDKNLTGTFPPRLTSFLPTMGGRRLATRQLSWRTFVS